MRASLAWLVELLPDGAGPVLDIGCGPGHLAGHLHAQGIEVLGVDLSPAMIEIAHRAYPGPRFEVGSLTDLQLTDRSVRGVLAFYSTIHVPDPVMPTVASAFHRVLCPGGIALIGLHLGEGTHHKTEGYGGHPMNVFVHRRSLDRMSAWLRDAGFTIEAQILTEPDGDQPGGVVMARRPGS